ncbi:MAG TPA: adenosylhomocysteinase, partial [Candidatus Bathyarchaeia archaeon]|nr:adenosylhomocysteinase [Candidatus Bathyarchaeia archaeon]
MSLVKDPSLAPSGRVKMEWARSNMPVLLRITKRFAAGKIFKGHRVGMCLHLEAKTAVLAETFLKAGAEVAITGSNPLSTQDDVTAALAETGVHVYAWRGVTENEHKSNLGRVLGIGPDILIDDG